MYLCVDALHSVGIPSTSVISRRKCTNWSYADVLLVDMSVEHVHPHFPLHITV